MKNSKFFILLVIFLLFCNSHANNKIRIKGLKGDDSHFNNNEIEKYVLLYTNYERKKNGLNELKWDDKLALAARKHSEEMSKLKYFSHDSPVSSNSTLEKRIANQGITTIMVGENIITEFTLNISGKSFYIYKDQDGVYRDYGDFEVKYYSNEEVAKQMVKRWMASPGHRANILNPSYTHLGVGIVRGIFNGEDAFYGTQNFAGKFMDIKDIFVEDDGEKWIIKIIVEKVNKNIEKKLFFEYKINNKRKIIYLENDNEVVKIIFDKNIGIIQIDGCFGSEYSWIITDTFYVNTSAKDVNNVIKINM